MLLIVRLLRQLRSKGDYPEPATILQNTLESAELTVEPAPMLCVLFLAAQMQAMSASDGREDPARWILHTMEVAAGALILQTVLTLLLPVVIGRAADVDEDA